MPPRMKKIYEAAKRDKEFESQILAADSGNSVPGFLAGEIEKCIYVAVYMGWFVGHYGPKLWAIRFPEEK